MRPVLKSTSCLCLLTVCCSLTLPVLGEEKSRWEHKKNYEKMIVEPTLPVATDVPDRILLSWKQDPARSFSVTWRSKAGADAVAEIAPAEAGPQFVKQARLIPGKTSPLKTNLGTVHMHAATFKDLKPNTLYVYRVGSRRTVARLPWFRCDSHRLRSGRICGTRNAGVPIVISGFSSGTNCVHSVADSQSFLQTCH